MHQGYAIYDINRQETIAFLPSESTKIAFSADGKVAVTYTETGELQIWDLTQIR
jgi:WD40 repeat protein